MASKITRRSLALERQLAGRHLVQHRTERKQSVRASSSLPDLLRRHVGHRAQRRARTGQVSAHPRSAVSVADLLLAERCVDVHLGQSEIEDLGVPALGDENVRRLDVAMNDAFGVRGVERIGDLDAESRTDVDLQRTCRDAVLQRHAIEKLHGDERAAILLADFVDGADVGMIQRRRGARLAPERSSAAGLGDVVGQELQRDEAAESVSSAL